MYPFHRTELLLGKDYLAYAKCTKVILFGIGGVGSWCAESLIRSGIGHLTIVDSDVVNASNINRQLPATTQTLGEAKTEVLKQRLLEINPDAKIEALQMIYSEETSANFHLDTYDYIIDAIDSVPDKVHLIQTACKTNATFFSSMGAALKTNPAQIKTAEFWKVYGCPLAASLRNRLRKQGGADKKFICIFSDELYSNRGKDEYSLSIETTDNQNDKKKKINGTVSYMPAMFGMTLSSLVIRDLVDKSELSKT